ncbi:AraC family transcriptional regulator [Flavobacterium psychrotrophum]|uniref:AraC family transcriptional regulator n=1 Tax=Flavobacterium psychrotrophum TaxID=2294119 RepID=UPI000E31AE18|nr:AraC family transcriptional regulator [Flavobacterium psychrotrophum]
MIRHLTNLKNQTVQTDGFGAAKYTIKSIEDGVFSQEVFSIMLVVAGQLRLKVHGAEYHLSTGHLLYLPAGSHGQIFRSVSCLVIYNYSFTEQYCRENIFDTEKALLFEHQIRDYAKLLQLNTRTYARFEALYSLLCETRSYTDNTFKDDNKKLYFNLVICEFTGVFMEGNQYNAREVSKNKRMLGRFLHLVKENVRRQHSVQFYAEALFVSPGHLTKIVKQAGSKTVKQFIEEALVAEAKKLLNTQDLSLLFITEELRFSTVSVFCKFFKKHTKITPTAFRNSRAHLSHQ